MLPSSMQEASASMRSAVGMQSEEERNESCFPDLSYKTRLWGVVICFGSGLIISVFSSLFLWSGAIVQFAIFYTLGNVIALLSSIFLVGPKRQCQLMWKKERAGATAIYLVSLVVVLVVAFAAKHPALPCLILILIQFCAATWYTLSFIPFARSMVISCCKDTTGV